MSRRVLRRGMPRARAGAGCSRCSARAAAAARSTCWCRWCAARGGGVALRPSALQLRWLAGDLRLHLFLHRRADAALPQHRAQTRRVAARCASRVLLLLPSRRWCCPTSSITCCGSRGARPALLRSPSCSIPSGRSPTGASSRRAAGSCPALPIGLTGLLAYLGADSHGRTARRQPATGRSASPAAAAENRQCRRLY